ncbi:MAG: Hsp20/alpha crystallin family protein [Candidatus Nealsonbacteria bacterium DGGOD1a]|nr:MAG: Hsp20/alpha crystallin family protein [Candidatus Nealsonbacteria bacterium DGGOD1a]
MSFLEKLQKGMRETAPEENAENAGIDNIEESQPQEIAAEAVFASYKSENADISGKNDSRGREPAAVKKTRGRPKKMITANNLDEITETTQPPAEDKAAETKNYSQNDPKKNMANKKIIVADDGAESQWLDNEGRLAVNVYQTENDLVLQSAIAGIKVEDLDVLIEDDVITIKGNRANPLEETGDYFIEECYWGPFSRKIILPAEVDSSRADAAMKDGILTIRIPKIQREKKKKLTIKE